jgi:O-antigen ligase
MGQNSPDRQPHRTREVGPIATSTLLTDRPRSTSDVVRPLAGTAAVVLLVGATRWGSYIGVSSLYLTDVLVASAVVRLLLASDRTAPVRAGFRAGASGLLVAFLGYVAIRMALSSTFVLSQVWLRDGVPYLYALLGLVSASSIARASPAALDRTMTWIWRALVFHLVWVTVAGAVGSDSLWGTARPFLGGGIFAVRPDVDTAILGVTAGLLLRRLLLRQRRFLTLCGLLMVVLALSGASTRAGYIAVMLCLGLGFGLAYAAGHSKGIRRAAIVVLVPLFVVGAWETLSATTAGDRLLATVNAPGAPGATSVDATSALGTAAARKKVWRGVIAWTTDTQSREIFGAGMGVDFLEESHTLQILEGTTYQNVRSPHDYLIGSFARLGLVGVGLLLLLVVNLVRQIFRFRRRIAQDELLSFCAMLVVALFVVASLGVVLEAPFGAVPFWWAAGILLALARQPGESDAASEPVVGTGRAGSG